MFTLLYLRCFALIALFQLLFGAFTLNQAFSKPGCDKLMAEGT